VKEYVVHAKIKNNLLYRRIMDRGYKNINAFCAAHGFQPGPVGDVINMKCPAVRKNGEWTATALRLADVLGVEPEDLFTEEQRVAQLKRNDAFIELTRDEALCLAQTDFREGLERRDYVGKLMSAANLLPNQTKVLEMRYVEGMTREEVGNALAVTGARVQQIEAKALRRIRATIDRQNMRLDYDTEEWAGASPLYRHISTQALARLANVSPASEDFARLTAQWAQLMRAEFGTVPVISGSYITLSVPPSHSAFAVCEKAGALFAGIVKAERSERNGHSS
jgi:RNA polymerase sigma factor (sigma-70 family)